LAQHLPDCSIFGVDADEASIRYGRENFQTVPNLTFALTIPEDSQFDVIIASEVLEHVDDPGIFLRDLTRCLSPDGILIVTVPNGYGPSEIMSLLAALLHISGVLPILQRIKRFWVGKGHLTERDTLALSLHVNFFTRNRLEILFARAGLEIEKLTGRMFLHNFIFSMLLGLSETACRINARLGSLLPLWMVSDWMYVLRPRAKIEKHNPPAYQRNFYERIRLAVNKQYARVLIKQYNRMD
jgi:SAM-dependent methyltransferase